MRCLQDHGAPQQAVEIQEVVQEGNSLDITTAARDLKQGDPEAAHWYTAGAAAPWMCMSVSL